MLLRILNNVFHYSRAEVQEVIFDIHLFYKNLRQNKHIINEWHFKNVFSAHYWQYMGNYRWLNHEEEIFLHQGILNLLLFRLYFIVSCGNHSELELKYNQIEKAVCSLKTINPQTNELRKHVCNILKAIEDSKSDDGKFVNPNSFHKSINWTLHNIILTDKSSTITIKNKYQKVGNLVFPSSGKVAGSMGRGRLETKKSIS